MFSASRLLLRETWVEEEQRGVGDGVIASGLSLPPEGWKDLGGVIEQTMMVWRGQSRYRKVLWKLSYIGKKVQ